MQRWIPTPSLVMIKRICAKLSGRSSSTENDLNSPLLDSQLTYSTVLQLSKTFRIDVPRDVDQLPNDGNSAQQLDYSKHDDIEGEYTTVRVFLRHQLLAEWAAGDNAMIHPTNSQLLPDLSDKALETVLRSARQEEKLHLRQEDVRGCCHCELPHQGFRPLLWDLLLRSSTLQEQTRPISDEERELIGLDAARTRFSEQLVGRGLEANAALSRVLLSWLGSMPPDAEYRQGADSLAAVVLSVVGRSGVDRTSGDAGKEDDEDDKDDEDKEDKEEQKSDGKQKITPTSMLAIEKTSSQLMGRLVSDFVPGYFFRGDTTFLQEQLARVRLVLWFWDPELAVRLFDQLQISPAMFAVPWFITLFADVWNLDRVAYVWDALFSVGPPLLTFLAVAVLRAKRHYLLKADQDETFSSTGDAFSNCMQIFSRLNAGDREEMPNVRWCVLKALSMYSQMPTAVVRGLEHDQLHEHQRHTSFTSSSSQASSSNASSSSVHDDDVVVDIERDRRFGSFSRNERGISDESSSGGMDEIARRLSKDTTAESGSKNHDGAIFDEDEETWDDEEDDDGLVVCEPPSVGWSDVSSWLVENSCVTVDLRNCDETQHQWLVQRYDPGSNNGGVVIGSDDSSSKSRRRKKTNSKNMRDGVSRKRTSFLHVPFIPTDLAAATLLVTRLIVLLRNWGAGSGYVVLVTWKDEQSNAVVSVASALMRAAIPRVCSFPMDRRFQVQGGSLLSGSTPAVSPRTQRRFQRNIRRSLNGTQGPNVF